MDEEAEYIGNYSWKFVPVIKKRREKLRIEVEVGQFSQEGKERKSKAENQ